MEDDRSSGRSHSGGTELGDGSERGLRKSPTYTRRFFLSDRIGHPQINLKINT